MNFYSPFFISHQWCGYLIVNHQHMRYLLAIILYLASASAFAQCTATPAESFENFIPKFAESKPLALSRTIYPTYTLRIDYSFENRKEITSAIRTPVSKIKDETTPTIKQILAKNEMAMEIKDVKSKQATVAVFKPNSDWLLTYHFINRLGCWYLHHIEDHSL